jgi:hypothetical protein
MFAHVATRSKIVEAFSERPLLGRIEITHPAELPHIETNHAIAIWGEDPAIRPQLPHFLVTPDGYERDWLAWLVTYAPGLRPFTASCRVSGLSAFIKSATTFQPPDLGHLTSACIGLILGEMLSSEDVLARPRDPMSASACASVLSFVLLRELAITTQPVLNESDLPAQWLRARQVTNQRERNLAVRDAINVAEVLRVMLRGGPIARTALPVLRACQEMNERGELRSQSGVLGPILEQAAAAMNGTREERVNIFEAALGAILQEQQHSPLSAFGIGYLASRINPGALAHAPLVAPALVKYPAAMMWYGVCAGLTRRADVPPDFGWLGRRVLRELLAHETLLSRPRADLAFAELDILLNNHKADDFVVWSPTQLTVELAPGVATVLNWSSRARSARTPDSGERVDDRSWIEYELTSTINRLIDLHRRMRGDRDPRDRESEQGNLFDPRPGRRAKNRQ